jgi:hypothetical protein
MGALLSAVAIALAATASGTVKIPATMTAEIATDGRIAGPEWSDAKRIDMGEGVSVLIKADTENVAIAVKNAARGPQYTDLFIADAKGQVWNLHASMNVGERKLEGSAWTDAEPAYVWRNNATWFANAVVKKDNADEAAPFVKQVKAFEGQEFLIARSQFPGNAWRLRIEVRDFAGGKPDLVYPATSDRYDTGGWTTITLP